MGTDPDGTSAGQYTPYEIWVRRLYMTNLFHPVKMGLTNMQTLHQLLGRPMDQPHVAVIHIAGTNGKGSVALKIAHTLQQQHGITVGLFCSPHISSFRERMQVNADLITEEEVVHLLPTIYQLCQDHDIPATFFEITTALAFTFFQRRGAQVVVLETGLGGRLDATNVIQTPALSIITSIGLEHTRILGHTIELIAREKAGIIKPQCPVLVGPHVPHETILQSMQEIGGGPYYTPDIVLGTRLDDTITDYDEENARIAKAALTLFQQSHPHLVGTLSQQQMDVGTKIRPPCRFQVVTLQPSNTTTTTTTNTTTTTTSTNNNNHLYDQYKDVTILLDVAHNPPAMEYLIRKLQTTYPHSSFRFVVGMSSDKDLGQCARMILSLCPPTSIHLVQAAHPRAAKLEAIFKAELTAQLEQQAHYDKHDPSITKQIPLALELANQRKEILVICGSVFLMAEAREVLGFDEPRDSDVIAEVAGAGVRHGQENFGNTPMEQK